MRIRSAVLAASAMAALVVSLAAAPAFQINGGSEDARAPAVQASHSGRSGDADDLLDASRRTRVFSSLGPTHFAGRIRALVVRPDDPNTIWAAAASGGLWVTHDANNIFGNTWSHASDVFRTLAFSSLVIDPSNPNVMYAGTGEIYRSLPGNGDGAGLTLDGARRGAGILKTTDGGANWNELTTTTLSQDFQFVSRIAVSPQNPQVVLAAAATGLWRSANGGASWGPAVHPVTVNNTTFRVPIKGVFLDVKFHSHDAANAVATGLNGQTWFSKDGGLSFFPSTLPAAPSTIPANTPTRIELAFLRSQSDVWFAVQIFDENTGSDPMVVLRSTDGGAHFANRSNPLVLPCGNNRLHSGSLFVSDFGANIFVGGTELCQSNNGGVTFAPAFGDSIHNDYHSIVRGGTDSLGNGTIFIGNDGGVFRILDPSRLTLTSPFDSAVLNMNNGLVNQQFYGAAVNPSGLIVGGAQDIGSLHRDTNGVWTELIGGPGGSDGTTTAADPTAPDLFYFGKSQGRLYRNTTDGIACVAGASGFPLLEMHDDGPVCSPRNPPQCNPLQPDPTKPGFCVTRAKATCPGPTPILIDPKDPNTLFVACRQLWRTGNVKAGSGLIEWFPIKPEDTSFPDKVQITAMALAGTDRNVMYVGTRHAPNLGQAGELWMTTQLQAPRVPTLLNSWVKIAASPANLPPRPVSGLAVHPTTSSRIYVSYSGWPSADITSTPSHNLFRGIQFLPGRFHFSDISAGLPPGPVYSVTLSRGGRIAAGTEFGVRISDNDGGTWALAGPRAPIAGTTWIDEHHLMVASYGRGVYVLNL